MTQEVLYDVSHILDSNNLKVSPKPSDRSIDYLYKTFTESKPQPSGRIEIEQLNAWLIKMKETHIPELDTVIKKNLIPKTELAKKVEDIYGVVLKELVKQVSVQSKLRGELIESSIETLKYIWCRYPEHLVFVLNKERESYSKKLQELKSKLELKVKKYKTLYQEAQQKISKFEQDQESLSREVLVLKKQALEYRAELNQQIESKFKELEDVSVQTDPETVPSETEKVFFTRSLSRTNSIKEVASRIQFNLHKVPCEEDTIETEDKSPLNTEKERFMLEFQKIIDRLDLDPDIDPLSLVETILNSTENIHDWLSGFRLAQNLITSKSSSTPKRNQVFTSRLSLPLEVISDNSNPKETRLMKKPKQIEIENLSADNILHHLLIKTQTRLQKYAKNTKKKILKHVNHSIYHAIGKKFTDGFGLADLVLQELVNRYNVKLIAERKFKELVVGCIFNMNECLRIRLFACALGCASYSSFFNFSVSGTEFFMKIYENMISSKTGVIFDSSDPLDIELYPMSRALEVVKSLFSRILSVDKVTNLITAVKKLAETDLNHVNKDGVVRLDLFVEVCMKVYEEMQEAVEQGCKIAVEAITDLNYLTKGEATVLIRHLAPRKLHIIKNMNFDSNNEINSEDFQEACLHSGALTLESVEKFFENMEQDWKVILQEVQKAQEQLQDFKSEEGLSEDELQMKLDDLNFAIRGKRKQKFLFLWHLMKAEIGYLLTQAN